MAKYLVIGSYTAEGMQSVMSLGGTARQKAIEQAVSELGGRLESLHFAFGEDDVYAVVDLPTRVAAAAIGMAVGASGMARCRTVVLLTPEEIDEAAQLSLEYVPPGA